MTEEFQKYHQLRKSVEKKELVRDIYFIFEECLNYGRYGHAASLALLPQLKDQIPKAKIEEIREGLSDIIKRLDELTLK